MPSAACHKAGIWFLTGGWGGLGVVASGLKLLSSTGSWKQQFRGWGRMGGGTRVEELQDVEEEKHKSGLALSKCRRIVQGLAS